MTNLIEAIDAPACVERIRTYLRGLQDTICAMLEAEDGHNRFMEDAWEHPAGGGGFTRVLAGDGAIEKAGVNFSHVHGTQLPQAATQKRPHLDLNKIQFEALGVSVVVHPRNPFAPTTHANIRFILVHDQGVPVQWWFGGGFDLTPYYGFDEDCRHWHQSAKDACDPFGAELHPHFKQWCDDYFYLKHRNEPRGIGGIFYDDLNNLLDPKWTFAQGLAFMQSVGNHLVKAYGPILARRKDHPYTEAQRRFQAYRRGRYVEFNLLYDRGTLFGLQSKGRTESILMSLPPKVIWEYNWQPEPGSPEALLYSKYLQPQNWLI